MKVLALERDLSPDGATTADLQGEAARVWELYRRGVIREIYFRADRHQAVLLLECSDVGTASAILDSLPLVQKKIVAFDLIPLLPYSGWERLFKSQA